MTEWEVFVTEVAKQSGVEELVKMMVVELEKQAAYQSKKRQYCGEGWLSQISWPILLKINVCARCQRVKCRCDFGHYVAAFVYNDLFEFIRSRFFIGGW